MENINLNTLLNRETIEDEFKNALNYFEENKNNLLTKRGIYIYGAPGVGKSYFVKKTLKEMNYDIITFDAGDIRNKSIIETITKHNMADKNIISLFSGKKKKLAVIMDEIDGMNSGDKGGINTLIKLIMHLKMLPKKN